MKKTFRNFVQQEKRRLCYYLFHGKRVLNKKNVDEIADPAFLMSTHPLYKVITHFHEVHFYLEASCRPPTTSSAVSNFMLS